VLSAVCLVFRMPILRLMNTSEAAMSEALGYSTVCIFGLVFIYGYNIVSAVLRGIGDSKHPFFFIGNSQLGAIKFYNPFVYHNVKILIFN
jgi:Na+-driven multidrug efflux pump